MNVLGGESMLRRLIFLTAAFTLIFCHAALATNFGKISGQVIEASSGDPLIGVNVVIEGTMMGAATDANGKYTILQVPPGSYTIRADAIGYKKIKQENVGVRVNRITYADFSLISTVLDMSEVTVVATRPVVEKDMTATMRSVSSEDIDKLPTTTVNDVLRTQTGVVSQNGLHFRGGRSGEVTYLIDGVAMSSPLTASFSYRPADVISRDAISEMQVISGTYSAEYGNSNSGIINITTKEGGSKYRASVNLKSSAAGVETASVDNNRNVIRANLGGPLLSSKTNFFISTNFDDRDNYLPWGFRNEKGVFAKVTDRHLNNFKFTVSYNYLDSKRKNYSHSYKYIPDQYWYEPQAETHMAQLGLTHTLAPNLYYTLMLYYNLNKYESGDYDYNDLSYEYERDANKEFYIKSFVSQYEKDDQQTIGVKGNVLWQANNYNELKAGFEVLQHKIDRFFISSPYYTNHLLDDYVKEPLEASAYVQDKVNFSSIILSAGLRFDMTDPNADYWATPLDAFYNNEEGLKSAKVYTQLSPRFGISYPVTDKTVFHFGYGHYFQRPEYQFIYKSIADENYRENVIMNYVSGNGRFGNPDLKPEKSIQYEFGLSNQLLEDYLLNVSVYSKKYTNLVGTRTFYPAEETYVLHINEDFAFNNGLEIQLRKMRGRNIYGELNYTYAVAEGSSSRPLERVGDDEANRQSLKFFPLNFDQRHNVNAYLTLQYNDNEGPALSGLHLFEKFRTSFIFQYGSGLPWTAGIRGTTETYEINNKRLPGTWSIDMKVDREIDFGNVTIAPYLEIYNLTDRKNVVSVDSFTGKPDYIEGRTYEWAADPENWGPPRLIYLGIRFQY